MQLENRNQSTAALSNALRAGGLVILMRHERTEVPSRGDDYSRPANDCNAQRNLSVAGIAGAAETGVAIRAVGWPIGRVLSSEMCRATETARFMFNRYTIDPRLMHHDNTAERTVTVAGRELNALLADIPRGGTDNTVLVSHIGNIFFAIGLRLSEGEFAVLQRQEDGSYVILGAFDPGYIGAHARAAQMEAARPPAPSSN
jgi:phosphohistidine phosphatase SixA